MGKPTENPPAGGRSNSPPPPTTQRPVVGKQGSPPWARHRLCCAESAPSAHARRAPAPTRPAAARGFFHQLRVRPRCAGGECPSLSALRMSPFPGPLGSRVPFPSLHSQPPQIHLRAHSCTFKETLKSWQPENPLSGGAAELPLPLPPLRRSLRSGEGWPHTLARMKVVHNAEVSFAQFGQKGPPTNIPTWSVSLSGTPRRMREARGTENRGSAVAELKGDVSPGEPVGRRERAQKLQRTEPEAPSSVARGLRCRRQVHGAARLRVVPPRAARRRPCPRAAAAAAAAPRRARGRTLGPILQPADDPGDDDREERQDAGHRQADGPHGRGRGRPGSRCLARGRPASGGSPAAVVVDEDEAGEEQHHHGEEGEDHAHAASGERRALAVLAAVVGARGAQARAGARPGGLVLRVRRRLRSGRRGRLWRGGGGRRGGSGRGQARGQRREAVLGQRVVRGAQSQREGLGELGVVGQAVHAAVGQRRAVAAYRACDGAGRAKPGRRARRALRRGSGGRGGGGAELQLAQALLAEGVQARQQLRRTPVRVEVVVADFALVVLERREARDRLCRVPGSCVPAVRGSLHGDPSSLPAPGAAARALLAAAAVARRRCHGMIRPSSGAR
ncbi:LOW QUALITY PROTEIN: hypothetical protein AAY473_003723 [Plecturocebus cupreus]